MMTDRIWVLGAPDPEMEMIERLLVDAGERVEYATVWRDGGRRRVTPAEAYAPDVEVGEGLRGLRATAYMVECTPAVLVGSSVDGIDWAGEAVTIDHHRPGDPGYAQPPSEFFEASSIGQVIAELAWLGQLPAWPEAAWPYRLYGRPRVGVHEIRWSAESTPRYVACVAGNETREVYFGQTLSGDERSTRDVYTREPVVSRICEIPEEYLLAAAADHCLGAAYQGECPGVDPDALMRWRVAVRAAHQGRPVDELLADVERARAALREAPRIDLGAGPICDMRDVYTVQTVLVVPFVEGATVDSAGVGDSTFVVFGPRPEGAWDEGGHHTFVERGVAELPEAAVREGKSYLATVTDRDGRQKVVLGGHTTPETVRAFLTEWAPAQGLADIYGDPARGFAGGYLAT